LRAHEAIQGMFTDDYIHQLSSPATNFTARVSFKTKPWIAAPAGSQ